MTDILNLFTPVIPHMIWSFTVLKLISPVLAEIIQIQKNKHQPVKIDESIRSELDELKHKLSGIEISKGFKRF